MIDFLKALFSADGFMPHGHCYLWRPGVLWLHITSDALIALAYYSIPFTLVYFTRKRRDVPFNWMFLCFAIFIIACGTTHLMEIWVIWHPTYWLSGSIKAITALVSVPTAILLVKLLPQALALPSPKALKMVNVQLEREIAERQRAEEAVRRVNDALEQRVAERTRQLETINETLVQEALERQRLEQKSQENEKLLQAIIDNSLAVIFVKDLQGRYLLVNRRFTEVFHIDKTAVVGRTDHDFFKPEDADAYRAMDQRAIAANGALTEEETAPHDDGLHTYLSVKSPLWDAAGKPYAVFGVSTDITERKEAEEKIRQLNAELEQRVTKRTADLEAANKELEAFSYSVSHDLRAPLRAINGFAGIVLKDYGAQLPEEARDLLKRIGQGGRRMGELIDDLLAFSRLGRQYVSRQPVDSVKIVQAALDELKPQWEGRQVKIQVGTLPPCQGDPALLKQVWVNLLSNAIKYTRDREPAIVEVGCLSENGGTTYFVRDNGVGFNMQYANKLFGVFQRLHLAEEFEGTGVGLAIVQRIINRHGGQVWAEAKVNGGATFYFALEGKKEPA